MKRAAIAVAILACAPTMARAQSTGAAAPRAGTLDATVGVIWNGGYDAGRTQATETRNPSVGSSPFALFQAEARLGSVAGVEALADVYVGRRLAVEVDAQVSRPVFRVHLASDAELAVDTDATETMTQYLIGASALYHFDGTSRLVPFAGVGGGYLRQLHAGNTAVETGNEFHAQGGIKYWPGTGRARLGLRAEGRVSARDGSVGLTSRRRLVAELRGGVTYRF